MPCDDVKIGALFLELWGAQILFMLNAETIKKEGVELGFRYVTFGKLSFAMFLLRYPLEAGVMGGEQAIMLQGRIWACILIEMSSACHCKQEGPSPRIKERSWGETEKKGTRGHDGWQITK